jgi:hypothetical protein
MSTLNIAVVAASPNSVVHDPAFGNKAGVTVSVWTRNQTEFRFALEVLHKRLPAIGKENPPALGLLLTIHEWARTGQPTN